MAAVEQRDAALPARPIFRDAAQSTVPVKAKRSSTKAFDRYGAAADEHTPFEIGLPDRQRRRRASACSSPLK